MTDLLEKSKRNVICIKWGDKFGANYVNSLYNMVERNLTLPHRFICFTDKTRRNRAFIRI